MLHDLHRRFVYYWQLLLVASWLCCRAAPTVGARHTTTTIACVGDSITAYACASNASMTYPAQLQRRLDHDDAAAAHSNSHSYTVLNFGASGHTMLRNGLCGNGARHDQPAPVCGGDCSYWNSKAFTQALASEPDSVLIMMGTNDAKYCNWYGPPNNAETNATVLPFVTDYRDMIQQFQSLPTSPTVFVVLPPPLTHPPRNTSWPAPFNMSQHVINTVFPWLQRDLIANYCSAKQHDVRVIDVWGALGGSAMDPQLTCDGCHPKDEALGIIAETIAVEILRDHSSSARISAF